MTVGQWVQLNITINGKSLFQVYSLGNGSYRSENNIFSVYNLSYSQNDVYDGRYGNFKRIVDITNSAETKSNYYVRLHKVLTNVEDTFVTKLGFEDLLVL